MWIVRLTDKQLEVLRALLRAQEHLGPALQRSLQALDLARWDELPEAELPWAEVAEKREAPGRVRGRRRLGPVRLSRPTRPRRRSASASPSARRRPASRKAQELAARAPSRTRRTRRRSCGRAWRSPTRARSSCGGCVRLEPGVSVQAPRRSRPRRRGRRSRAAQRPHRVAGAQRHAGVDVLGTSMPVRLHQPHGVEQVREQQPVDDEPGLVGDLDRGLAEPLRTTPGRAPRTPSPSASGRHSSTSSILRDRVEDMKPEEPLGVRRCARPARAIAQRRGRGREVRSAAAVAELGRAARPCVCRSSTIASTTRSRVDQVVDVGRHLDVARVAARRASPPRSAPAPPRARPRRRCGRARGRRPSTLARAARPHAITPLPAIAGRSSSLVRIESQRGVRTFRGDSTTERALSASGFG